MSDVSQGPGWWQASDGKWYPPASQPPPPPVYGGYSVGSVTTDGRATASLVFGILGFIVLPLIGPIVALILGVSAKRRIRAEPGVVGGDGMATAGIVLGSIGLAMEGLAVLGLVFITFLGQSASKKFAAVGNEISPTTTITSPVAKLLAQAQSQFQSQNLLEAVRTYDQVIAIDPRNPEALAYKGWLLRLAGHQGNDQALVDRGLASIRAAEAAQPSYADAHFFAGEILLHDKGDAAGAVAEFEQFLGDRPPPDLLPMVQSELTTARAMAGRP